MTLRFKFDENLDPRWRLPLESAGARVSTVTEEGLAGADDQAVASECRRLGLCLVTADLGFGNPLLHSPRDFAGIIVLRHPKPSLSNMLRLVEQVARHIVGSSPEGRLWVVEPGRIRVHGIPKDPE